MHPYTSKRVAAGVLAALFTLCAYGAREARAQAGAGQRARAAAGARRGRTQPTEADEKARALLEEGRRHADAGRWDEALRAYRQAVALDPRYGDAYIDMGDAYMSSGKYGEAFAAYRQAISVAPRNPDAHYSLGAAYNDMANYGDAFKPFVQAIRLDPGFAEAHYGIGYAYLKLENFRDALTYLRQAVRLKPDYVEARLALGQAQLGLRNVRAAEGELKILADLDASAARVLEKEIRAAATAAQEAAAQEAAQPAAPARDEQAATRLRPKPSTTGGAPATSDKGAPGQSAQPRGVAPKSTQDAAPPPRRQADLPPAAQTQGAAFELSFWDSIRNSDAPEEFAAYIRKYPDGQFVELARIRMRALAAKRGAAKGSEDTTGTEVAAPTQEGIKQQAAPAPAQPSPTQPAPAQPSPTQPAPAQPAMSVTQLGAAATPQPPAPTTQQPSPAAQEVTKVPPPAERTASPAAEQPSRLMAEQPSKPPAEQPARVAAAQPLKEATAKEAPAGMAAATKESEQPVKESAIKEPAVKEPAVKEQPPEEKTVAAGGVDEAEAVETVEDAASLLLRRFPSAFTYRVKTAGAAPATSEVSINYEPLHFDGCQISWRDSKDTLAVSLSDLDAGAVTVSRRARPLTTFSVEVWNVTIATEGGRGAISEEKGDGSGAVNVYNGLDLQYDSRRKADGVANALRRAIRLCTGKM
ncbi:MAG TPA: tetratricopeptide repeat protein [Pyrinomonadaceae bacterium]|jgi:tetratricopeptide (TPR) repeat protein